jgi:hypothetical protein
VRERERERQRQRETYPKKKIIYKTYTCHFFCQAGLTVSSHQLTVADASGLAGRDKPLLLQPYHRPSGFAIRKPLMADLTSGETGICKSPIRDFLRMRQSDHRIANPMRPGIAGVTLVVTRFSGQGQATAPAAVTTGTLSSYYNKHMQNNQIKLKR